MHGSLSYHGQLFGAVAFFQKFDPLIAYGLHSATVSTVILFLQSNELW
jgi:hypothetical protein